MSDVEDEMDVKEEVDAEEEDTLVDADDALVDEENLKNLEKEVSENPIDYQRHINLIEALRNAGELDTLREARRRFASVFPLTPALWLEWINDERRIDTPWDEIRLLFDKAVQDYLSVQLWLEYVQFACGHLTPSEMRELCERALTHVGLHVADGRLLWDAYRVFESAMAEAVSGDGKYDLLYQIFKRQLSIPLLGAEETRQEFLELFGEEKFDGQMRQAYDAANEELRALTVYETELQSGRNQLDVYWRYLDFEEGRGGSGSGGTNEKEKEKEKSKDKTVPNIARLQCLYERAIADHCLNVDLWLRYVNWLNKRFTSGRSIADVVLPIYERAVRNCSWSSNLWTKYALACERSGVENWNEKADSILERAIKDGGYMSAAEATDLWLTRAYQKRRAADAGLCDHGLVAGVFENGANFLKEKFGDRSWDTSAAYRRAWASYLKYKPAISGGVEAVTISDADVAKARALWQDILASDGNGRLASVWLDCYNFERRSDDLAEARKILYRALNSVTDFPDYIVATLRQFELEEGSLRDLDEAEERIRKQKARLEERKIQQHALTSKQQPAAGFKKEAPTQQRRPKPDQSTGESKFGKRKNYEQEEDALPVKKQRVDLGIKKEPNAGSSSSTENKKSNNTPDAESRHRTVFVSNLSFALKEEQLKEVFESQNIGNVVDVRLAMLNPGRSKGFGHVEFESADSVPKALAIDRYPIEGRPMYISEYKKPGSGDGDTKKMEKAAGIGEKNAAAEKYNFGAGLEKNKLFVRNIPKHATEADLRGIFEPLGELKSVRLVTFPSGQSKGLAYIEYGDPDTASKALLKTDATVLFGKELSVAISNPPPKRQGFGGGGSKFQPRPKEGNANPDRDMMPPPPSSKMLLPRALGSAVGRKPKLDL